MAGLDGCGKLDISEMSPDNIIVIGNKVWVRAEVEEKIWIYDSVPCTVIKLGEGCYARLCDDLDPIPKALIGGANGLNMFMDCPQNAAGGGENENNDDPQTSPGDPGSTLGDGYERRARSADSSFNKPKTEQAKNNVDIRNINALGWQGMAVIPSAGAIPMKSNIATYGPYASSNFGGTPPLCNGCAGGTQVEVNTDLAPWVFGSIGGMNSAGQTLVESSAIGLVKAETGAITLPGMPISQFTQLGSVLGSGGATLSSMNFSYGSGGISTSYEFRTYTPKFGGLSRHLIDRIKDISRNRTEALKFFRNQEIMINKAGRQRNRFLARQGAQNQVRGQAVNNNNSLQRLFVGEIYDWQGDGQRTVLGTDKLLDSAGEMVNEFDRKAYASWDYFYGPISKYGDGNLPRYAVYETGCHLASSDLPQPPYAIDENPGSEGSDPLADGMDQYNLDINQDYLDPLTNKFNEDEHHHDGEGRGHVVDIVGRGTGVPDYGLITNFYRLDDEDRYSDDYRFFALRGPIVLHSWGYDTQGKPIPNEADTDGDTKEGKFKSDELKDAFMKDWLAKPASWPVAPIDFRFDRKRGLWVTPPGYRVVVAVLDEKLERFGTAQASLINKDTENDLEFGPKLYDKDGEEVKATDEEETEAKIKITDRIGKSYPSGTRMYCYYDTFKCEYIVIEAATPTSIRFKLIDICENSPMQADYGDDWTKHGGYGDKFPNNHIIGVRIDCNGDPINNKGDFINHQDIQDALNEQQEGDNTDKRKAIFINLYDTCGKFGSAYAYYDANGGAEGFNTWKERAATGFALLCDPISENTCGLGESETQCLSVDPEYDSYDIVFLDQYARFVECELKQKLYMTEDEVLEEFPDDEYKNEKPEGNAAAELQHYYGDPGNGIEPKFYKNDGGGLKEIEFRVFDPFEEYPKHLNPFAQLDYGDKVLAVFDENRKKYIIYQSLRLDEKVIKFALVDNKDIRDRISRAVLVDLEGYPIDAGGQRLTQENFEDNFITVFDPFAIHGYSEPKPKYHNWGTTGFGPALGSDDIDEHLDGITLKAGDWTPPNLPGGDTTSVWKGGPFIGYALQRKMTSQVTSEFREYEFDNEIIFLESFAHIITGKIASTYPVIDGTHYLGALRHNDGVTGGFIDGRIPFTRDSIVEDDRANVRVSFPLDQHYAGKYITGDFIDNYKESDVYNNVDGCKFVAKLDHVTSRVNGGGDEKLFYTIIEVENIANRVKTILTKKERSDELNKEKVKERKEGSDGIISQYMDGFMWDKEKSQKHYEETTILNRYDWTGRALIMQWKNEDILHIRSSLAGYDQTSGNITYQLDYAGTIAQIGEATVPESLGARFGFPNAVGFVKDDYKIGKFNDTRFYHGISPLEPQAQLANDDQPIFFAATEWMTYENGGIVGLYEESNAADAKIENATYRVVYAREAPVIITGKAYERFRPEEQDKDIVIETEDTLYASCPGVNNKPIPALLGKIKNPMGYGAEAGDWVTVQRVNRQGIQDDANYYYIVIGTSKPPEDVTG